MLRRNAITEARGVGQDRASSIFRKSESAFAARKCSKFFEIKPFLSNPINPIGLERALSLIQPRDAALRM
jgi:hypothetical protein